MTADADSYVAWDGKRYEGSPPTGWYLGADNKWWPSSNSPSGGTAAPHGTPPPQDPPPPQAVDAVVPTRSQQIASSIPPPSPRPATLRKDIPVPVAWAPTMGGQPPPPTGPPAAVGAPPPKRRLHPAMLVVGVVGAIFLFGGFLDDNGYEVFEDEPQITVRIDDGFEQSGQLDGPTTAVETPPPTTVTPVEFFDSSSGLSFLFFGCTGGFLEGAVDNNDRGTNLTLRFTVLLNSADGSGGIVELRHEMGPVDPFSTEPFRLLLPPDLRDRPDCQDAVNTVFVTP